MARAGVNYIHVVKAAEAIKERGLEPTVDRVREYLGTGSKSTIAPLLKQWKAQNEASNDISGLPSDLVEVVKSLYKRVQQDAVLKIEDITSNFNETISELKQELTTEHLQNSALNDQNNELTLSKKRTTEEMMVLRDQVVKHELEAVNNASIILALKDTVKEAKEENRGARESLEHYQTRVAEERQSLSQQQQVLTQQFQEQVRQSSTHISEVSTKLHDQQQLLNKKERELHTVLSEKQQLQNELANKQATVEELRTKIVVGVDSLEQLSIKHEIIQKEHDKIITSQSFALNEVELLNKSIEYKQSELIKLQNKLCLSDDAYKQVLQEKALIQGQFKQLQKSVN